MEQQKTKNFSFGRTIVYVGFASIIFLTGWGIGSGRIVLSSDQLFRKSIQKKGLAKNLDYSSVNEVYDTLKRDFDGELDDQKVLDGIKSGLAGATGDPHTEYLNKDAAKEFNDQLTGTFTGIGAELSKDAQGNLSVIAPIAGFPAEKAGLKPKDVIVEIDGTSTAGLSISDGVAKIRGPKGSAVSLKIFRGGSQEVKIDIIRDQISIASVTTKTLEGNIGYIKISRFAEDTVELAEKAAVDFKKAGVKGIILDVRNDPGGLLNASVKVSSLWLPSGKTVLSERRDNVVVRNFPASGPSTLVGIPTIVLINEGSASASEIVAGALRDNGAATLLGEKSYGKGSVQQLEKLKDGGVLKVTIAHWYTPNGVNIDKEGLKPDKEVKLTEEDAKNQRDPQLDTARAELAK